MRTRAVYVGAVLLLVLLLCESSYAWGPKAQEAITQAAMQSLRREIPSAFVGSEMSLQEGARAPDRVLEKYYSQRGAVEPFQAVATETRVLTVAGNRRLSDYLAYRFGMQGQIVADLLLPFGLPTNDRERQLKLMLERDIEFELDNLRHTPTKLKAIQDPEKAIAPARKYLADAKRFIESDYTSGQGFDGYSRRACHEWFQHAVDAVANVWYTALRNITIEPTVANPRMPPTPLVIEPYPTAEQMANFYVGETVYFILKGEKEFSEQSYSIFEQFNPGIPEAYAELGDAYYTTGDYERAMDEYRKGLALKSRWPKVESKVTNYYFDNGRQALTEGDGDPGSQPFKNLETALQSFKRILEVAPANRLAIEKKNEVETLLQAKSERLARAQERMASAQQLIGEGAAMESEGMYSEALVLYKNAEALYTFIEKQHAEFSAEAEEGQPSLPDEAADGSDDARMKIETVLSSALGNARDLIQRAGQRELEGNYTAAIASYDQVPGAVTFMLDGKIDFLATEYDSSLKEAEELKTKAAMKRADAQRALEQQQMATEGAA